MIEASTLPHNEPIYTFVADDGENTVIASRRLREWANKASARGEIETIFTPLEGRVATKFISEGSVSREHTKEIFLRLALGEMLWPILYAAEDDDEGDVHSSVMCVDGHHTYVAHVLLDHKFAPAQVLLRRQWEPFRVAGLPPITKECLRAMPFGRRKETSS